MRFALSSMKPLLKKLASGTKKNLKSIAPQSGMEWAMELTPNALFAASSLAAVPEGTDLGTRLGVAGEDLAGGLAFDVLGRLAFGSAARGANRYRKKPLQGQELENLVRQGQGLGSMALSIPGAYAQPRPFFDRAMSDYEQEYLEEQRQAQAIAAEERRQALVARFGPSIGNAVAPYFDGGMVAPDSLSVQGALG